MLLAAFILPKVIIIRYCLVVVKNNGGVNYYAQPVHWDQAHIVALDEVLGLGMVWGYVSERMPKRVAKKKSPYKMSIRNLVRDELGLQR